MEDDEKPDSKEAQARFTDAIWGVIKPPMRNGEITLDVAVEHLLVAAMMLSVSAGLTPAELLSCVAHAYEAAERELSERTEN